MLGSDAQFHPILRFIPRSIACLLNGWFCFPVGPWTRRVKLKNVLEDLDNSAFKHHSTRPNLSHVTTLTYPPPVGCQLFLNRKKMGTYIVDLSSHNQESSGAYLIPHWYILRYSRLLGTKILAFTSSSSAPTWSFSICVSIYRNTIVNFSNRFTYF